MDDGLDPPKVRLPVFRFDAHSKGGFWDYDAFAEFES